MNKKIKYLAVLFAVCLALCACGGKGEAVQSAKTWEYENAVELKYDCFGGNGDVMPLLGFWSAPREAVYEGAHLPELKGDEYYTAVKESGVNLLMQANDDNAYYEDTVRLTLDYCDKYDLGYLVTDTNLFAISGGGLPASQETIRAQFGKFAEHKSFAGAYLIDEPTVGTEAVVRSTAARFYEAADALDMNIHPYINLFPYWATWVYKDLNEYVTHLNAILKDDAVKILAYDIYPNQVAGFNYEGLFTNLSVIRKQANERRIPWTPFVDAGGEVPAYQCPTEGMLTFNVNIYLAFGAKGINYFPINSPISFSASIEQGTTVAMFDWYGNKTQTYYYVKEINKQITAVDEYLMHSTNHGVIMHGTLPSTSCLTNGEIIESGTFRELTSVEGDGATVGCFDYYGKTCLYVVNNSLTSDAAVELGFDARYRYDVIQRGEKASVKGKKIPLQLAAGEAAFILLK